MSNEAERAYREIFGETVLEREIRKSQERYDLNQSEQQVMHRALRKSVKILDEVKCKACGAKDSKHCDRWDCPTLLDKS